MRHYHERDRPHCPKIGEMPNGDVVAVLDGQQRLTALNIGLRGIGSVGFKVDNFNRDNMQVLERGWPKIKEALTLTVELVSSFGFSGATLKADSALLPIAYYLHAKRADSKFLTSKASKSDRKAIRRWLIASLLKPSGVWGSGLDTLLTALREVIRKDHENFPDQAIRKTMQARGKSLDFNAEEIEDLAEIRFGDKRTFPLLSLIFDHLDLRQNFHIDHVFPKSRFTQAKLRKWYTDEEDAVYLSDLANRLPNLQLLEGHENVQKRAKSPDKWLNTLESPKTRRAYRDTHLLNGLPERIDNVYDSFEDFYEKRRKQLKRRITSLLDG